MLKWVGGIVAAVIAGVAVWYITRPPDPQPPRTFLEKLSGEYTLRTWNEANRPVTMGVNVAGGELKIDTSGNVDWELSIWDSALHPQGPPADNRSRIKCGGAVISSSQELRWVPGGQRNAAIDWVRGIDSVRQMVWLAYCGGHVQESAPFELHYEEPSSGRPTLEMKNSEGVYIWEKK